MYSRDFDESQFSSAIPESYGGTMLSSQECEKSHALPYSADGCREDTSQASAEGKGFTLFDKLPFKGLSLSKDSLIAKIKNIGLEEILIGAVAIYLILSEEKDIECALILIALLFVS